MAFAGKSQTILGTPSAIQTALTARCAASTIKAVSITPLGNAIWQCCIAYDNTAAGGQTAVVATGGTLAATNSTLDTAAALATASIDAYVVVALGDAYSVGVIVYK